MIRNNIISKVKLLSLTNKKCLPLLPIVVSKRMTIPNDTNSKLIVGFDGSPQHSYFKQPEPQLPFAEDTEYWENLNDDIQLAATRDGSIPKYQS